MGQLVYFSSGSDRVENLPKGVNAVLLNVPDLLVRKASAQRFLDSISKISPKIKMLDSGGKQIFNVTSGRSKRFQKFISEPNKPVAFCNIFNLHPTHWKNGLIKFKPHIATALDYPVLPAKDSIQQKKAFQDSIKRNVQWAKDCIDIRNTHLPETQIFLPVQGFSVEDLDYFLDRVGTRAFDGLSLPMRIFKDTGRLLDLLLQLRNRKIKKVHLLGTSRMDVILLAAYLTKQDLFHFISFDSCRAAITARKEKFLTYDLREVKIIDHLAMRKLSAMPTECSCDICEEKLHLKIQQLPRKELRKLLLDHNYTVVEMATRTAFSHAGSLRQISRWVQKVSERKDFNERIIGLLEKIDRS